NRASVRSLTRFLMHRRWWQCNLFRNLKQLLLPEPFTCCFWPVQEFPHLFSLLTGESGGGGSGEPMHHGVHIHWDVQFGIWIEIQFLHQGMECGQLIE